MDTRKFFIVFYLSWLKQRNFIFEKASILALKMIVKAPENVEKQNNKPAAKKHNLKILAVKLSSSGVEITNNLFKDFRTLRNNLQK